MKRKDNRMTLYTLILIHSMRNNSTDNKSHESIATSLGMDYNEYLRQLDLFKDTGIYKLVGNYINNINIKNAKCIKAV